MHVEHSGVDEYDAVIAGVASPLAPSSRYLVSTAQTVDEAERQGKLVAVMIDDPDVGKISHGSDSALRIPGRLERPFFMSRPGMGAFMDSTSVRRTVLDFVERTGMWSWGTVLWPGHPWAVDQVYGRGSGGFRSVPVDLTATLRELIALRAPGAPGAPPDGGPWFAETTYFSDHFFDPSMRRAVYAVSFGDRALVNTVAMVSTGYGMVHGNAGSPGWWTPNPSIAEATSRLFCPHPDEGRLISPAYYIMPSAMEDADPDEYIAATSAQHEELEKVSWRKSDLHAAMTGVLGPRSS
jgi:hypothetical protein